MSYKCAAVLLDNLCFCGTHPSGMAGDTFNCTVENVKVDCSPIADETVDIDVSLSSSALFEGLNKSF